jgi:hypothetical protein
VDSADDSIRRFVVHLHAYDWERRERRPIEVAAFDSEDEAMRCLGETRRLVLSKRETGEADEREHVTIVITAMPSTVRTREW